MLDRSPRSAPSFFVVMINYPRRYRPDGVIVPACQRADVNPEETRREIVDRIKSGEYRDIAYIWHFDGMIPEDLTAELLDEAEAELKDEYRESKAERIAAEQDHARDIAKHGA